MQCKELMTEPGETVVPSVTLKEAETKMSTLGIEVLPVTRDWELIGLVTTHDIIVEAHLRDHDLRQMRVSDVMKTEKISCRQDQAIEEAATRMGQLHIRSLPVTDSDMNLVGMIALNDIAQHTHEDLITETRQTIDQERWSNV